MIARALIVAMLLSAPVMLPAAEESAPSMKGWVLFSWQTPKGWYFSLLPGSNRAKSWGEVNLAKVQGWDALRNKLRNLQPGERLEFGSAVEVQDLPSERALVNPERDVRKKIVRLSKEVGFKVGSLTPKAATTLTD
jgi:hypothetical protein